MMRGVDIFFFIIFALLLEFSSAGSTQVLTVSSNRTIKSLDGVFEVGVTTIGSNSSWYLAIWFAKKEYSRRPVWIANREKALPSSIGILTVVSGAHLHLLDHSNSSVWSTELTRRTRSPLRMQLLNNSNFVLSDDEDGGFLWQSFDFPTDTLLPEMKLKWDGGINNRLIAWKSPTDPSSGHFTYGISFASIPELLVSYNGHTMYRRNPKDTTQQIYLYVQENITNNTRQPSYSFTVISHHRYYWRLSSAGSIQLHGPENKIMWESATHLCDMYGRCGPNSYCDSSKPPPYCHCIKGFRPKNPKKWHLEDHVDGCERGSQLKCGDDAFELLYDVKLPATEEVILYGNISERECRDKCLGDCCTAYTNTGGWGCVIWTGDLIDIRTYDFHSPDLNVRLAASKPG